MNAKSVKSTAINKVCPFMTTAFQFETHSTNMGQIQKCIKDKCMAWGVVIKPVTSEPNIYGCKLIERNCNES